MALRVGQISYANCIPIFSALRQHFDCSNYHFTEGVPSELNKKLLDGEIDLCPSSSILYAHQAEELLLIPDLSISSQGPVRSVLLYTKVPLSKLDCKCIALTTESATSVALLRILLKKYLGFSNSFVDVSPIDLLQAYNEYPAVLVIGDTALRWVRDFPRRTYYDLGELWYRFSGFPFVFALWMIRKEVVQSSPKECSEICERLQLARILAKNNLAAYAASNHCVAGMAADSLVDYWRTISYELTSFHQQGVRAFFRFAREIGVLEYDEPELRFVQDTKRGE